MVRVKVIKTAYPDSWHVTYFCFEGSQNYAASINAYGGSVFWTGFILAHETAHNLGISHSMEPKKHRKMAVCSHNCTHAEGNTCTELKGKKMMGGNGAL